MAYTAPKTWVANATLPASEMNTYVRDNTIALYGTDSTYTPTLSQGVSTNIAKTVTEARYIQHGRIVTAWVLLTATAAGTAGSAVTITLPVTASGHSSTAIIGSGSFYDASATTFYTGMIRLASTTTCVLYTDGNANTWGTTPSIAVASGDFFFATFSYVVA